MRTSFSLNSYTSKHQGTHLCTRSFRNSKSVINKPVTLPGLINIDMKCFIQIYLVFVLCQRACEFVSFLKAAHKCNALRNLVPFTQFKKREKHPWRSVNFSKVAGILFDTGWNTVATSGLVFLRATWICWLVVLHLMLLLNLWLVIASRSLFCTYCFGRCSYELVAKLIPLLHSYGSSTRYFDRLVDFSIISPYYYEGGYPNNLFPGTALLQNSFPGMISFNTIRNVQILESIDISHLWIFFQISFRMLSFFLFFFFQFYKLYLLQ